MYNQVAGILHPAAARLCWNRRRIAPLGFDPPELTSSDPPYISAAHTMPFAPNDPLDLLFDASLVSQTAFDALSERGLHVRPLPTFDPSALSVLSSPCLVL